MVVIAATTLLTIAATIGGEAAARGAPPFDGGTTGGVEGAATGELGVESAASPIEDDGEFSADTTGDGDE